MKNNNSSGSNDKELKQLGYSDPECWCESIGHYTNSQGQEFDLRVRGTNPDSVVEYMKTALVSFEVLPAREDAPEEEETMQEEDEKYQNLVDEEFKNVELYSEFDLEIDIEVINTQGIELPYILNTVIDPPIAGGATHKYRTKENTKSIKVTLNATQDGGVSGLLSGRPRKQADTYPPNPPKPTALFSGKASPAKQFSFSVTGLKASNNYTYNSSTALVRV